jgi:hypothetical protein
VTPRRFPTVGFCRAHDFPHRAPNSRLATAADRSIVRPAVRFFSLSPSPMLSHAIFFPPFHLSTSPPGHSVANGQLQTHA